MNPDQVQADAQWGFAGRRESLWGPRVAIVAAVVIYILLPAKLSSIPYVPTKILLPTLELALIIALTVARRNQDIELSMVRRVSALCLIGLINLANLGSLVQLVDQLVHHASRFTGPELIYSSLGIWLTNVIVFGLWYWELDRGGPAERRSPSHREPDFLFPQMSQPHCARPEWAPDFVDYLYVSLTNATAFSPTDTMPLTHWAKILMGLQSIASLLTIALVAARAVNILA
jgi:hypothetical protein